MSAQLEWLRSRQNGVGSSDSPVLALGEIFKKTPVNLYIDKKKTIEEEDAEDDNPNFRRGHFYEPLAAAMFEQQTGIKVFAPGTDEERYKTFQLWDVDSPMFADLDGFCDDGWVLEIKSPMQRVADSFKSSGIKDYYQIQAQHLAYVANRSSLPFLGADADKWKGKIKGTRLVVFECENVALQIIELPLDPDMTQIIRANAIRFWADNVLPEVPPSVEKYEQPKPRDSKAKYTQQDTEAWRNAVNTYKVAKEREKAAERSMEAAKKLISDVMRDSKLEAVQVGRHKFLCRVVAGKKLFSKTLLQADFPNLDLAKYEVQGEPHEQFNYYGPKDRTTEEEDAVGKQIITVQVELDEFAKSEFSLDEGMETFDELRSRADLYAAVLEMELGEIRAAIEKAANAVTKKLG